MAPQYTSPQPSAASAHGGAAHHHITREVLAQGRPLMERVAEATRMALQTRQDQARTPGESNAMREARQELSRLAPVMAERFPDALSRAIAQSAVPAEDKPAPKKKAAASPNSTQL